jgi:predicted regulator of Ras-like GTPase activity (Roadblock/LC7/MglB family)
MSTLENIDAVLENLENAIPGQIEGTVIASGDGFVITDTLQREGEAEEVAAMVATTMGVSTRMTDTLNAGEVQETSISGEDRSIFLYRAGGEGVLGVVASGDANVGMIHLQAREAAQEIESLLSTPSAASAQ